jgi:hypothetical protein
VFSSTILASYQGTISQPKTIKTDMLGFVMLNQTTLLVRLYRILVSDGNLTIGIIRAQLVMI